MSLRPVKRITQATPALEGAGVKLRRAFGFGETSEFDPFLLFDDFRNERPEDYLKGFPWHPHRGIETITYVLAGTVEHGDSLGNRGTLGAGDVQWMTAGRGILHQEMPQGDAAGRMHGFQLWANLPSSLKMTPPRYQDVHGDGHPRSHRRRRHARAGGIAAISGASAARWMASPPSRGTWTCGSRRASERRCRSRPTATPSPTSSRAAARSATRRRRRACSPSGAGPRTDELAVRERRGNRSLVAVRPRRRGDGRGGAEGIRFLLVSGKPIEEPVAWYGPIVMNTEAELRQAIRELNDGTFIEGGRSP